MVYPVTQIAARYMYDEIWWSKPSNKSIILQKDLLMVGYWDGIIIFVDRSTPDESRWYSCFFDPSPPLPTRKDTVIAVSRMTNMSKEVCCLALQLQCPSGNWILVYFGAWFHWWVWQSLTKSGGNKLQCANWWHSLIRNVRSWIEHQVPYFQTMPWCR